MDGIDDNSNLDRFFNEFSLLGARGLWKMSVTVLLSLVLFFC